MGGGRGARELIPAPQRNKHQTESVVGKHQYFPRGARATNTRIPSVTDGERRATVTLASVRDTRASGTQRALQRPRERKKRKREMDGWDGGRG